VYSEIDCTCGDLCMKLEVGRESMHVEKGKERSCEVCTCHRFHRREYGDRLKIILEIFDLGITSLSGSWSLRI